MDAKPLGDQAVMLYLPDENAALAAAERVRACHFPWLVDLVQAYRSVAVFYRQEIISFDDAAHLLQELASPGALAPGVLPAHSPVKRIPCCYELALDIERIARHTGLATEEAIALHTETIYTVYAIGFCPGFPYLGYLPERLCGVPRLETPRLKVEAGSVGLTGRQTGIYTEERPGGWNIVGRTPFQLVDVSEGYFPLRVGDRVQFEAISRQQYEELKGRRLEPE